MSHPTRVRRLKPVSHTARECVKQLRTFRAKNEIQLSTFDNKVGYLELRENQ